MPKPPSPRWWSMESAEFEGVNDDWNVIVLEDGSLANYLRGPLAHHAARILLPVGVSCARTQARDQSVPAGPP